VAATDILIRVTSDASRAQRDLDAVASRMSRFQSAAKRAMVPAAAVGAALVGVGKYAATAASDLQQAQGAVESVFGRSSAAVEKYASTSASRLGVAKSEYLNSAALMGSALQNAGFKASQAAGMTDKAFTRSADLAATFGGTAADAMDAINAAVSRGEFDPLEKYAVSLNMTAVNAELAKRGQDKLTGAALKNAKAQIVLDEIYAQTAKVQGQFAREANTAAGAQQRAEAAMKDAAASLGATLLPAVAAAATKFAQLAQWVSKNRAVVIPLLAVLAGLVVTVFAVNGAIAAYAASTAALTAVLRVQEGQTIRQRIATLASAAAQKAAAVASRAWAAAQWLLNAAMRANPIGILITALTLLGVALAIAWRKSSTFRAVVTAGFTAVKNVVAKVIPPIRTLIVAVFKGIAAYFKTILKVYRAMFTTAWNALRTVTRAAFAVIRVAIVNPIKSARDGVRSIVGNLRSAIVSAWSAIKSVTRSAFQGVKSLVLSPLDSVVSAVRAIPGKITSLGGAFASAGRSIINALINGLRSSGSLASDIAGNVWQAVRGMLNSAIGRINAALTFTIPGPGPLPSVHVNPPDIPYLASGGIVTGPTLAVVGDNPGGREAIIPLNKYDLGGGGTTVVEVYLDGKLIDRKVDRAVGRQARRIVTRGVA